MDSSSPSQKSFSGRTYSRKTSLSVRVGDFVSRWLITIGGIGTIIAVSLVLVLLVWVVFPLFLPASLEKKSEYTLPWNLDDSEVINVGIDEFQILGWALFRNGEVRIFQANSGETIHTLSLFEQKSITSISIHPFLEEVVIGFEDGTVQTGIFRTRTEFYDLEEIPEEYHNNEAGQIEIYKQGALIRIPTGQFRYHSFVSNFKEPLTLVKDDPIVKLDHSVASSGLMFSALTQNGTLSINSLSEQKNFLTGETLFSIKKNEIPFENPEGKAFPYAITLSGLGDQVYVIWEDGELLRYETRDVKNPVIAERTDLIEEENVMITSLSYLIGQTTLLIGDSAGRTRAWFRIRDPQASTIDKQKLVAAHELPGSNAPVTSLSTSQRSRTIAVGYGDGSFRLFYVTAQNQLVEGSIQHDKSLDNLILTSKEDGLYTIVDNMCQRWFLDLNHPETSFSALFSKIWYEGHKEPAYVWQSSSATDDFEPKYSLIPLIFGTLKATLYSMLIGLPLALLAAIYTSEFLHPKGRLVIKPLIEMMASLPSVVLGFLAALVFAPFVEKIVPTVLTAFVTIPLVYLVMANIWQLLPQRLTLLMAKIKLLFIFLVTPLGVWLAIQLGPLVESFFFSGDIKAWLNGQVGNGTGGWMMLLLPLSALLTVFIIGLWVNPTLRRHASGWSRTNHAWVEVSKFVVGILLTFIIAYMISVFLSSLALDPRGFYLDTYEQRNALIVGFVMGFAIIPIIYTIADDALSSVPEHLRAASLGCGATPWQTAIYVIIPTGMSGLFSATMVGLGRAVGETMIVLMAAGNTPVLDWNIFNGFRTLSANIAVEMPEAVRNSTHYRTLFLAALTLFIVTFIVNTVAEIIRLRFRKKAVEL